MKQNFLKREICLQRQYDLKKDVNIFFIPQEIDSKKFNPINETSLKFTSHFSSFIESW